MQVPAKSAIVSNAGVFDRRAISVGGADGDRVEVAAGLTAGESALRSRPFWSAR